MKNAGSPTKNSTGAIIFRKLLCMILAAGMVLTMLPAVTAKAVSADASRFGEVLVSDNGTGATIQNGNTSRKLAVASDGTIYAAYHCNEGIRVAKSNNNGQSFQSSVLAYNQNLEAEIAVSTDGTVYLTWKEGALIQLSKSTDDGMTFSAPITVGPTMSTSVHMDTDGNYVYIIASRGDAFYRSADAGNTFSPVTLPYVLYPTAAFSDVHVDSANHNVIVQEDNPVIKYYVSTDYGVTFEGFPAAGAVAYYSVGSVGSDSTGHYLFTAGADLGGHVPGVKINLDTNEVTNPEMGVNTAFQGRSLSSDIYGNVVTGYSDEVNVYLKVSNDLGSSFGDAVTVAQSNVANAAINTTNGDILFLYERAGQIYLKVYSGMLDGYVLNISNSKLYFNADINQNARDVIVTNTSGDTVAVNSITATGDFTVDRSAIGSSLVPNESAAIHVNYLHSAIGTSTGSIIINYGSPAKDKIISLTGYRSLMSADLPVISLNPQNEAADVGGCAAFSVDASSPDGGSLRYQWQSSTDGISWSDISGATDASYQTGVLTASDNGTEYRCIVTNTKSGIIPASLTSDTATLTVNPVSGGDTAQKTITGFQLDYTAKTVPYGTSFASLNLPQKIKVTGDAITGLWVKVSKWVSSTFNPTVPGTYTVTAVLDSGYVDSGYVDSGYVLGSGVTSPEINVTVKSKTNHNTGNSSGTAPYPAAGSGQTETKVNPTSNTATVTTKPSSVTITGNTVDMEVAIPNITTDNTATSNNGSSLDTAKKADVIINVPTEEIKQQLNAKKNVELTLTVPSDVAKDANANLAVNINANKEVLQAAKENLADVTIKVKDADTQQLAYSWTFKGEDLAKSNVPVTDVNIAMSVHLTTEVPKVNVITPDNKGLVLSFDHSGALPSVASVSFSVLEKGFKPGQTLYFYYYNPTTGQIESLGKDAYTVDAQGNVTVRIVHCSDYVLLPNAARFLTLDTKTYTMPVKGKYEIGIKLANTQGTTVKVYSSTGGVASITKLKNGNYQVTGLKSGLTYIMFDVFDEEGKLIPKSHASVRLTVKKGTRPTGDSTRQVAVF